MPRTSNLRQVMKRHDKTKGVCDLCGKGIPVKRPPLARQRLKGICWDCMRLIDEHPATGKGSTR